MLRRGRRSALMSARNEAAEALRDACTRLQSCDLDYVPQFAGEAQAAIDRLREVSRLWCALQDAEQPQALAA